MAKFKSSRVGLLAFSLGVGMLSISSGDSVSGTLAAKPLDTELVRASKAFSEVAKKAIPAVVSVRAYKAEPGMGVGSGVVIRADGLILTNHHVIDSAERVEVSFDDEHTSIKAKVLGIDPRTDIALLQLDSVPQGPPLRTLNFGDSDQVEVGDWAIAIGNPFGLPHSVTSGIISAKGRARMGVYEIEDFLQTDAAINPGNSGGPLLNLKGEMIGLNAAIFSQSGGFVGIGFSIPSKLAKQVADDLVIHGHVIRGWIGISAQDLNPELAQYFKMRVPEGALVNGIEPGGPAEKNGILVGDIVSRYEGHAVEDAHHLRLLVNQTRTGRGVSVEVLRSGKRMKLALQVREQPAVKPLPSPHQLAGQVPRPDAENLGLALQDIPPELAPSLGAKPGTGALVVAVIPGGKAYDAGLTPGDVIISVNQSPTRNSSEVAKLLKNLERGTVVLYVQRGPGNRVFIPVKPEE